MTDRHTVDSITSDQLDALYARIETLEHVAAGNRRHVQQIVPDLERAQAERDQLREVLHLLRYGLARAKGKELAAEYVVDLIDTTMRVAADGALEPCDADAQANRARIAETELRVLRAGLRANGADPTQIQNLWAQIRLRNRQWRDEKRRAERAEAAIERVRTLHQPQPDGTADPDGQQCKTCSCDGGDGYQYLVPWPCPTVQALGEPTPAATEATEAAPCCGKPSGAICVHDVTPPADQTTEK
ncbi:hypothetical protein GCM10022384_07590 [Streptomyces marokkonensis]|uniref:Uncharacterized protein n=1 Tax=Streptomyces marokkonensis TaxID=324855 RepID=A0ABP7P0C1_9ACTN